MHTITNQNGKHILDEHIIAEVNHIIRHGLDFSYCDGKLIRVTSDKRKDGERHTVIEVEGI